MENIQDTIASNKNLRTFKVDDLLFAEFKCRIEKIHNNVWCHNNYLAFIHTGETMVKTPRSEFRLRTGDSVFAKKGGILFECEIQDDFCELIVFVPDDFIKSVIRKYKIVLNRESPATEYSPVFPFGSSEVVRAYFHTLLSYFNQEEPPPEALLKLKFEELIVSILSNAKHLALKSYFNEISRAAKPSIKEIMDNNFTFNLTLPQLARLCARSLSSFKSDFYKIYKTTPGKWIQKMRLEYSRYLMDESGYTFDEICSMSGFSNKSNFARVFKKIYGITPAIYRMRNKPAIE